jgi:hypothetical protein
MLNQDQWYNKLKSWVPSWFFESEFYNVAIFKAVAKLLSLTQESGDAHFAETFILQAGDGFLDTHGEERNILRLEGEPNYLYAKRVQNIINSSNKPAIKALVDALLIVGECKIVEHMTDGVFCNRGSFLNRDDVFTDRRHYNYFSVIIPPQIPQSNSYLNREMYASRGHYAGSLGPLDIDLLLAIINVSINKARAAGVFYRILEQ